jgi:type II secretory pathway component GspD/PulD (secretin)
MANAMLEARPGDGAALALKEKARYLQMLRDAKKATKEKEYEDAVKITNEILEARPHDKSALALKEDAKLLVEDRRHNAVMDQLERLDAQERNKYFENLKEKSIPYDDLMKFTTKEKWEDIKKRAQKEEMSKGKRLDESREHTERLQVVPSPPQNLLSQEMGDALNKKKLSIEFIDTPLSDVVVFLQEKTGVNFVLDKNVAATNVNVRLNDVTARTVLNYILPKGIDAVVKDNVVHITLEPLELRVYDVRDLLINLEDRESLSIQAGATGAGTETEFTPGEKKNAYDRVQEIISLITDTVEPASWSINDGRGRIAAREGMLGDIVVTHVARIHKQTEDLLTALRSSADLQIVIEARFIKVTNNFLEAFGNQINELDLAGQDDAEKGGIFTASGDTFIDTGTTNALGAVTGLNLTYQIFNGFFLKGFLKAVQESDEAETITAPRITLSNTQRGTIKVVTTSNYVETFEIVSQTPKPVVEEIDSGTTFSVRPVVSADRKYVYLEVHPVITSVDLTATVEFQTVGPATQGQAGVTASNFITLPVTQKQELSVTVCVPDKGTLMIGGLGSREETKTSKGVPILSKIPIIKRLFSSNTIDRNIDKEGNLIILVKPTILIREEQEARFFAKEKRDVEFLNPLR